MICCCKIRYEIQPCYSHHEERSKLKICQIIVAERVTMCEVILMIVQQNFQRIVIQSDLQLTVNSINGKFVLKDIIIFWKMPDFNYLSLGIL